MQFAAPGSAKDTSQLYVRAPCKTMKAKQAAPWQANPLQETNPRDANRAWLRHIGALGHAGFSKCWFGFCVRGLRLCSACNDGQCKPDATQSSLIHLVKTAHCCSAWKAVPISSPHHRPHHRTTAPTPAHLYVRKASESAHAPGWEPPDSPSCSQTGLQGSAWIPRKPSPFLWSKMVTVSFEIPFETPVEMMF